MSVLVSDRLTILVEEKVFQHHDRVGLASPASLLVHKGSME